MNVTAVDSAIRQIAITSIRGYQKHISPRKGFSCAHRLLHGGDSCSQYVKRMIAQDGLTAAIKASRQRFQACQEANQILRARYYSSARNENNYNPDRKNKPAQRCTEACQAPTDCGIGECPVEGIVDGLDCASGLDCGAVDCSALDCASGLDCGAVDCGALDCGSCGS